VVVHGDSPRAGYGPGITVVMTAVGNRIRPASAGARNVADLLGLRLPVEVPA
jgi:hypothetical protein